MNWPDIASFLTGFIFGIVIVHMLRFKIYNIKR